MSFERVAFVWPGNSWTKIQNRPGKRPACTVAAWPMVLECDVVGWDGAKPNTIPVDKLRRHDVFIVNLFTDSVHVTQIKKVHPDAFVIAMPDPYLELVLYADHQLLFQQMAEADAIGGRTQHDVAVYGALFDKPAVWLPSPVGPMEAFRAFWNEPKEDVIIAMDHNGYPRSSAVTIAALAIIQRRMPDVDIHFYRAGDKTKRMADIAGLRVTWKKAIDYPRMVQATARARFGMDLYDGHSQGRNLLTHAMAGTPVVGSYTNNPAGTYRVDPYCPEDAAQHVLANWKGERYEEARKRAFEYTELTYGFYPSRRRMEMALEELRG